MDRQQVPPEPGEAPSPGASRWPLIAAYRAVFVVFGAVVGASVVRWALHSLLGASIPFITYYPTVALVALFFGARAGFAATLLSVLGAYLFFMPDAVAPDRPGHPWVTLALFAGSAALISWLADSLRTARQRLKTAVDLAKLGIWEYDPWPDVAELDGRCREIFGMKASERLTVDSLLTLVHLEDKARVRAAIDRALNQRSEGLFSEEFRILRNDGGPRWVAVRGQAAEPAGTRRFFGTLMDVSERRQAEQALGETAERLVLAQAAGGVGVFDWNPVTGEVCWTPELEKIYGMKAPENPRERQSAWLRGVHPEDRGPLMETTRQWLDSGEPEREWEYRFLRPDGEERWIVGRARAFRDSEHRVVRVIGTQVDQTEKRRAELDLLRAQAELRSYADNLERLVQERTAALQEVVTELEHFCYTITHDLRAPLRAMRGFAEAANEAFPVKANVQEGDYLQRIKTAADHMESLIRDALSYRQFTREELPVQPVDVAALVSKMLESYPELHPFRRHIKVVKPLPVVLGNPAALAQCFANLLGNAIKFAKAGQEPEVRVGAQLKGARTRIWVEDRGIGISPEILPQVFEIFTRGDRDHPGSGIGLALVRAVIQRLGGTVGVESERGEWTRFWFELPLAASASTTDLVPANVPPLSPVPA